MGFKIKALLIAAVLCLAFTGLSSAASCDVKCTWEPCGEKIEQSDVDATYTLMKDNYARIMFGDTNSNGVYDKEQGQWETIYVDMTHPDGSVGPNNTEAGDIRLSWNHDNAPNEKLTSNDSDRGDPLVEFECGQAVIGFVDINNDGVYDLGDPLYVDTDCSGDVSVGDLRLTERNIAGQQHDAYTTVESSDMDISGTLLDPATYTEDKSTQFYQLIGYIDSDCSKDWSCPDKLYLQQLDCLGNPDKWQCTADEFVTIGDLRLYIPPEAIAEEDWPECGTKVMQCNEDATYVLDTDPYVRIVYGDTNSNGEYDKEQGQWETVYVDMTHPVGDYGPNNTEAGDIRLSWNHDNAPNEKLTSNDSDRNDPIKAFDQYAVKYDTAGNLYVDTDDSGDVSVGDLRLSAVTSFGENYDAYTTVETDDMDAISGDDLGSIGEFSEHIGYVDSDCSNDWSCPDKLYLQPWETTDTLAGNLVTIYDFRLYIPPSAIAEEGWPECGTWVEQCNVDAQYVLTEDEYARIGFGDVNSNGVYDDGETVYADLTHPDGSTGPSATEAGDVRLSPNHGTPGNTKLISNDSDRNDPMAEFECGQTVIGYVDVNNDGVYDCEDPLYVDTDCNSEVSIGDIRLTERTADSTTYEPYTMVESGDRDLLGNKDLKDPVTYQTDITTEFNDLIGFIDSDASGDWTCPDKLYLQQMKECDDDKFANCVTTIGDLRLYIPPEEVGDGDGEEPAEFNPYDANENCVIELGEVNAAIDDYRTGQGTTLEDVNDLIDMYRTGEPYCEM